jgi:hypothetical protein
MRENLKFNPPTDLSTINADHLIQNSWRVKNVLEKQKSR